MLALISIHVDSLTGYLWLFCVSLAINVSMPCCFVKSQHQQEEWYARLEDEGPTPPYATPRTTELRWKRKAHGIPGCYFTKASQFLVITFPGNPACKSSDSDIRVKHVSTRKLLL